MKTKTLMLCGVLAFVLSVTFAGQLPRSLIKLTGGGPETSKQWTVIAMQTPGEPALSARLVETNVMVYWPSSETNYHLMVATNQAEMAWLTPSENIQDDNTNKFILMTPQAGLYYYQLEKNR